MAINTKKRLQKKSQIYLLTAILLCITAFIAAERVAKTRESNQEPLSLFNNFVSEAPYAINSALYADKNLSREFYQFTAKFIQYSSAKNINLSLFYVIAYNNEMFIYNGMGISSNITTSAGERELDASEQTSMSLKSKISVESGGMSYNFIINENITQFKLVFKASDINNNTEVYTYG